MAKSKFDIYEAVTNQVLEALDRDIMPWRKPWVSRNGLGGDVVAMHKNFASKRPYRGINPFLLEITALTRGYSSPYWLSFKQAKEKGGQVRKGEKSTLVVFWKPMQYSPKAGTTCPKCRQGKLSASGKCGSCNKTTEKIRSMILKHYNVFNIEQCDGIEAPMVVETPDEPVKEFDPITEAERIINEMPKAPPVRYGGDRASYSPPFDSIQMPNRSQFESSEAFYSTLFHEHVHATGHESRLDRKDAFKGSFGDPDYAREELVAEMGASMLCAVAGVENNVDQSAAYIRNWMTKADYEAALKADKKLVVFAAARAQKASDFILGVTHENGEES
jgi:antirestriction protein ArdC